VIKYCSLIRDVKLIPLKAFSDSRGIFTEVYRKSWDIGIEPVQWNVVRSEANVLRGVHAHIQHDDYLLILEGEASIGLKDLRLGSPTFTQSEMISLSGTEPATLFIPKGVAHGFYFHTSAMHLYSVSHYWNLDDELGCFWNDPALELDWPATNPLLSERDASASSLADMMKQLQKTHDTLPYESIL